MKQCPQCKLVYADVELNFCLEDGAVLVERTAESEPATAIIPSPHETSEDATRSFRSSDIPSGSIPAIRQTQSKPNTRRWLIAAVTAAGVLIAGFFGYRYLNSSSRSGRINSIAVLPFENTGGNPDAEYLSDGLAESLIYRLSQIPELKVSPRSSVFRYKGKNADAESERAELGVAQV